MLTSHIWMRMLWGNDDPDAEAHGPPIVLTSERPAVEGEITLRLNDRVRPAYEPGSGRSDWWDDSDRINLAVQVRSPLEETPVQFIASPMADVDAAFVDIGDAPIPEVAEWFRRRVVTANMHQVAYFDVGCPTGQSCVQRFRYRFELVDPDDASAVEIGDWSLTADVHRGLPHGDQMAEGGQMELEIADPRPAEALMLPAAKWAFPQDDTRTGRDGTLPLTITYPPEARDAVVRFTTSRSQQAPPGPPVRLVPDKPAGLLENGQELADLRGSSGFTEIPLALGECRFEDSCSLTGQLLGLPNLSDGGAVVLLADVRETADPFAQPLDAPVTFDLG